MKKLLQLTTVPETTMAFLRPYGRHFRNAGWQVDAGALKLTDRAAGLAQDFDHVFHIPWSRSILNLGSFSPAVRVIRDIVERHQYDLVHVHTPIAAFLTRFALRKQSNPKIVYTAHGFHFGHSRTPVVLNAFYHCEKIAGRWTDALVVINRSDYQLAQAHRIVPPEVLHYMPGIGVDLSLYSSANVSEEERCKVRLALGIPTDACLFLMIAEFIPRKRHVDVLRAFRRLKDKKAHIAFAGTGPLKNEMEREARRFNVGNVHFLGFRNDIPTLLSTANALILASDREGLPRSIMEAMALGTPVLASRTRGNEDLLEENCGLLFPVGDERKIADCMLYAMRNPHELEILALNGMKKVKEFSLTRIINLHENLYGSLLDGSGTSACSSQICGKKPQ